jgi:hypothetical protein
MEPSEKHTCYDDDDDEHDDGDDDDDEDDKDRDVHSTMRRSRKIDISENDNDDGDDTRYVDDDINMLTMMTSVSN